MSAGSLAASRGFVRAPPRPATPRPAPRAARVGSAPSPPRAAPMPLDDRTGGFHEVAESSLFFRPCEAADVPRVAEIEANSYPADEAASPENLAFRQANAGDFFLLGVLSGAASGGGDELVSYVCGTRVASANLTHESMAEHDPAGATLCVHSVVTEGGHRRKQIGSKTLKAYVRWVVAANPDVETIALLCKRELVGFYEGAGFKMVGPSDVVHGADQWYEMAMKAAFARAIIANAPE